MSRRRMVYQQMWLSEQVGSLSHGARLLYVGTITIADDDGKFKLNPAYLRSQIFPYDEELTNEEIKVWIDEIVSRKLIDRYEVDESTYGQHPNWSEFQKIRGDMYKASSLPDSTKSVTKSVRKSTVSKDKVSKDKVSKYKDQIFDHWNEQNIVKHARLSKDASKEIDNIFGYPNKPAPKDPEAVLQSILDAITVFEQVLHGEEYFWTHKWNLYEFLKRGLKKFEGKEPKDYIKGEVANGRAEKQSDKF